MKRFILGGILAVILCCPVTLFSQIANQQFKQDFLTRINRTRQKGCHCGGVYMHPVAPLKWNDQLENAALGHARDMGEHNYFSHNSKDGRTAADRIIAVGYGYKGYKSYTVGENIAVGQQSIDEVMTGWFKSPEHCKNLMNADFKEIGVAQYNDYWVQDFGGREPFSPAQLKLINSGKAKIIQRSGP